MENVSSSNGIEKYPKLRFPNFDVPYKLMEFSDYATVNPKCGKVPDSFYYIDLECVNAGEIKDLRIEMAKTAPSRAQRLLTRYDILFQTVRPYQRNNYHFKKENDLPTVASTGYAVLRTEQSSEYLYELIHTERFLSNIMKRCTGTSFPAVSSSDIEDIAIWIPEIQEQKKIGTFLTLIDSKIAKQRLLIEHLKKYKRGILQKIFCSKNANWEKQRFGNFFTEHIDTTSKTDIYPICSLTVEDGIIIKPQRYFREFLITKEGDSYKILKQGCFAYNPMNAHIGAIAQNKTGLDVSVSSYYNIFSVNIFETSTFWEEFLKSYSMLCHYKTIATGSLIEKQRVHYSQFVEIEIPLPSIEEQIYFSSLLTAINNKIKNAEETYKNLQTLKAGLLQKIFI